MYHRNMMESTTFQALVLELSPEERASLLERLQRTATVSTEALYLHRAEDGQRVNYDEAYRSLGIITRIIITIKSMFTGVAKEDIVRDRCLHIVARKIDSAHPGLVDSRRGVLQEPFLGELQSLRQAARYFYDLLDRTLERNRAAFFAFLGSLEFEEVHDELGMAMDPYLYYTNNPTATDPEIRHALSLAFDAALTGIPENQRRAMSVDVKNLYALKKLSSFLFDRFLGAFQPSPSGRTELSLYAALDQLSNLCSILSTMERPPSARLMEAIFAFSFNDELQKPGFDLETAVKKEMASAERALNVIREFNATVPMQQIVKLAYEDPNLQTDQLPPGDDWFPIFKSYWRERMDRNFQHFSVERRINQLETDIVSLVGAEPQSDLHSVLEQGTESIPPLRQARVLRFIEAFFHKSFLQEINRFLKLILLEGEFYKRDNRLEFTDAYNTILQTGDALRALDYRLSSEGELGANYVQAKKELVAIQIRKRKVDSAVHAAENEAETIITRTSEAMGRMQMVLKGILAGEARSRYDSLSNLSRLEGKSNKEFQRSLEVCKDKLEKAVFLVDELSRAALTAGDAS
ncbi:MAG: DUF5312 family protein [Spirochaetota bacterium]